ncbi:MAG: NAD-dependent epimerase/dehydratase family protein [Desulfobacteraceae bacterium]
MKILVTGGAGFIGSNVVDGYIKEGHEVVVVDDLSSGRRENVHPGAVFYQEDIRSGEMARIFEQERPDVLNHHAAQISVPRSVEDPILDAEINIKGFLNLLDRAVSSGVEKVIFISSGGAVYGDAAEYPTSEACPPQPLSPYAVSKLASEYYLAYYRRQYGIGCTVLRYANIYGPRQIPHGEAGVVAVFMDNLLNGRRSVLNLFPGEEQGMTRDYTYVGDVVAANLAALEKGDGEVVNIGTGRATRTLELYQTIYDAAGDCGIPLDSSLNIPEPGPARPGDIPRSCLLVDRAESVLGWRPETDLRQGVLETFRWRLARSG